jgi:Secretion system C-terminal sorting domain
MNACADGLSLQSNAAGTGDMSDQSFKNNKWTAASYTRRGASAWFNGGGGGTLLTTAPSMFFVNPDIPFNVPPSWSPLDWFSLDQTNLRDNCMGLVSEETNDTLKLYFSGKDRKIFRGQQVFQSPLEEWDSKRQLVTQLLHSPSLVQSLDTVSNWLNDQLPTSHYAFAEVSKQLGEAESYNLSFSPVLDSLHGQAIRIWQEINGREEILIGETPDSVTIGLKMELYNDTLNRIRNQVIYWNQQAELDRVARLNNAMAQIESLPTVHSYEIVQKAMLEYQCKKSKGDSVSYKDTEYLVSVAKGCIQDYGDAVLAVRDLLPDSLLLKAGIKSDEYVNFDCDREQIKERDEAINNEVSVSIWPNPVSESLNIRYEAPIEDNVCELIDQWGRVVKSFRLSAETETISVRDIANGIYSVRVRTAHSTINTQQIVIQH